MTAAKTDTCTEALNDLIGSGLTGALAGLFEQMEWAEEEIEKARKRHPRHADTIYHSFKLLTPTNALMGTEFVYRSHCAELLDRVAAGQDTRPGTAAEVCCMASDSSLVAPLTDTAAGLYARMWLQAFPGHREVWGDQAPHYEALRGSLIDDLEGESRRKLSVADRKRGDTECQGMHHGDPVSCQYAPTTVPAQLELIPA
jgi:hypothetical protein